MHLVLKYQLSKCHAWRDMVDGVDVTATMARISALGSEH